MRKVLRLGLILSSCLPGMALAHTGVDHATGFKNGILHPISGIDHLLAMIAVGLWAAQLGGRGYWAVPATFVTVMVVGGGLGFAGVPVPLTEEGILVSILVLGLLIAGAFQLPTLLSMAIVGLFALFHGYAHGAEMPASMGTASYTAGFALATALLHVLGIGLGMLIQRTRLLTLNRWVGGAIAFTGVYLAIS